MDDHALAALAARLDTLATTPAGVCLGPYGQARLLVARMVKAIREAQGQAHA